MSDHTPEPSTEVSFGISFTKTQIEHFVALQQAKARLNDAAPDLLAACKVAVEACQKNLTYYQFKDEHSLLKALDMCREAIKKATK